MATGTVPVIVAVNDVVTDAALTREMGAAIAVVQLVAGKLQATCTAHPTIFVAHRRRAALPSDLARQPLH